MLTIKRSAMCSTRGGSQGTYITFASAMRIRQPTLALKPRGDITRNPKQGYQWPQNRTCVCVRQKYLKKKIFLKKCTFSEIHLWCYTCRPLGGWHAASPVPTNCCRGEVAGIRTHALRISVSQTLYQLS